MSTQPAPVIVGYDGSPASHDALRWATALAARDLAPLRIGGWSGLLVGSVAVQVTTHAPCPIAIVR